MTMRTPVQSFLQHWRHLAGLLYVRFLKPRSTSEDDQRREFIFTILLLGALVLMLAALASVIIGMITRRVHYHGVSPAVIAVPLLVLAGLYGAVRHKFRTIIPYCFLIIFFLLASYGLYSDGYEQPQAVLTYVLVMIMAGIVISSRAAFIMASLEIASMITIGYLQTSGVIHADASNTSTQLNQSDTVISGFLFGIILLVTWLSNRDIERSLVRARSSEAALRRERNSLEIKVRKRTRQLERAQVEKMMQLHRFAEFGRFSSTLLHELTNPLTSVALELEQLESKEHSEIVTQARKGIAYMEQYVDAARRQLRNQSEVKAFDASDEIKRVIDFISPKAKQHNVAIETDVGVGLTLQGDSIRFDQLLANLIANAIDASNPIRGKERVSILITAVRRTIWLELCVIDHGVGIPEAVLPHIFEPFYTTKKVERGTGIGLSVTKRAVEEDFGGTIRVTSSQRHGTEFIVRLPLYKN